MKNSVCVLLLSFLFVACQQKIKKEDIAKINGYWEIEKVVLDDGKDKDYAINESYDFFQIGANNTGIRKKVKPQLDGTFIENGTFENVKLHFEKDRVFIDYSTPFSKWTEELVAISKDKLVLKNAENKEYHYNKTKLINILGDGKKAK